MTEPPASLEGEEEEMDPEGRSVKGAVKGFLGKLRVRHHNRHETVNLEDTDDGVGWFIVRLE